LRTGGRSRIGNDFRHQRGSSEDEANMLVHDMFSTRGAGELERSITATRGRHGGLPPASRRGSPALRSLIR
jgi:hypothetical protein